MGEVKYFNKSSQSMTVELAPSYEGSDLTLNKVKTASNAIGGITISLDTANVLSPLPVCDGNSGNSGSSGMFWVYGVKPGFASTLVFEVTGAQASEVTVYEDDGTLNSASPVTDYGTNITKNGTRIEVEVQSVLDNNDIVQGFGSTRYIAFEYGGDSLLFRFRLMKTPYQSCVLELANLPDGPDDNTKTPEATALYLDREMDFALGIPGDMTLTNDSTNRKTTVTSPYIDGSIVRKWPSWVFDSIVGSVSFTIDGVSYNDGSIRTLATKQLSVGQSIVIGGIAASLSKVYVATLGGTETKTEPITSEIVYPDVLQITYPTSKFEKTVSNNGRTVTLTLVSSLSGGESVTIKGDFTSDVKHYVGKVTTVPVEMAAVQPDPLTASVTLTRFGGSGNTVSTKAINFDSGSNIYFDYILAEESANVVVSFNQIVESSLIQCSLRLDGSYHSNFTPTITTTNGGTVLSFSIDPNIDEVEPQWNIGVMGKTGEIFIDQHEYIRQDDRPTDPPKVQVVKGNPLRLVNNDWTRTSIDTTYVNDGTVGVYKMNCKTRLTVPEYNATQMVICVPVGNDYAIYNGDKKYNDGEDMIVLVHKKSENRFWVLATPGVTAQQLSGVTFTITNGKGQAITIKGNKS